MTLMGAASFVACSSSDEVIDNPDYDPMTNTVKAPVGHLFARLCRNPYPTDGGRSAGQSKPVFRGLRNIRLIPFAGQVAANSVGSQAPIENKFFRLADFGRILES